MRMKLNIPKVLFSNGKKNSIAYVIFSYVVGLTSSRRSHSHQEKPFYSSCQYSYKALKSSWKQTNTMLRTLISELFKWSLTHTHPLTKLDRFPVPPKTIKRTSSILRQFCFVSLIPQVVSLCLCRLFHKSYR